ncbi:hypothetical protein [Agrobacterium tumefaciens]|uniref:hypothetical protein n=1 Tax=Agrobacterium tumefaciens TaxID=358 RepID=UPI0012B85C4E|nr:hypothetical protein [Agrobacterium tumefaciens]
MSLAFWNWVKSVSAWATSRETIFTAVCWIAAAYFAYASLQPFVPAPDVTKDGRYILLLMGILFLLAPFAKKVEIAKVFSFESRLAEVKAKAVTAETKADAAQVEIRHLQMVQATLTNSLSSVSSNANANSVYLQFYNESKEAALRGLGVPLNAVIGATHATAFDNSVPDSPETPRQNGSHVPREEPTIDTLQQIECAEGDSLLAKLLILRRETEIALRAALGKSLQIHNERKDAKYLSSRQLFNMLIKEYPAASRLAPSFDFLTNTGNAAAHGQAIPDNVLKDALAVGVALLRQIHDIVGQSAD